MSTEEITEDQYVAIMRDMERRAVAEARACEDIPTEALEQGVVREMREALEQIYRHDWLEGPLDERVERILSKLGDQP